MQFQQSKKLLCLTFYSGIGICYTVLTFQKGSQPSAFQRVGHQDLSGMCFMLYELFYKLVLRFSDFCLNFNFIPYYIHLILNMKDELLKICNDYHFWQYKTHSVTC